MIAGLNCNRAYCYGGNQRIIGHRSPCGGTAATVRRFPHTAADRPDISHDAAIGRGSRIDCYGVNSTFGRRVIKTARTTGHPFRLRTERSKTRWAKKEWTSRVEL